MGYWQTKVLPKIKKVFENKSSVKKAAAAEAIKSFDESKVDISKEFEEKKDEYKVKVLEIYDGSSAELKTLIKERKEPGLKKYSAAVQKFLEELAKIEFPGSKPVSEAATKYGPAYVSGPVFFVFEKVSTYIPVEKVEEAPPAPPAAEPETATTTETREIVIEEEKQEEVVAEVKKEDEAEVKVEEVAEKKEEVAEKAVEEPASEAPKVEEPASEVPKVEEPPKP